MSKPDMSKWSAEQVKAYEAAAAALAAEEHAAAQEAAARKAADESPDVLIAAAKAKAEGMKRERERARRETEDDRAYAAAVQQQGGDHRVGRVRTHEGSIILTPMTARSWEEFGERLEQLESDADKMRLAKQTIYDTAVHPKRERLDEMLNRFPGLWTHLYIVRDKLIDGVQEEAKGKG